MPLFVSVLSECLVLLLFLTKLSPTNLQDYTENWTLYQASEHSYNEQADGAEWGIFISSNNSNDVYDWGTCSWQTFDLFQLFLLNEVITKSYFSKYVCYFLESEQKTRASDIFCSHATSTNCRFAPVSVSKSSRFVRIWKNFFSVFNIFFGNFFSFFFRWMTNWLRCLEVD